MNKVCEQMKKKEGYNAIPTSWYNNVQKGLNNVGFDFVAYLILVDILDWYTPIEAIDMATEKFIGYKQKFKGDKLRINCRYYSRLFELSVYTVNQAINHLVELGLITRDYIRPLDNEMYLEPIIKNILAITYPEE